MSLSCLVHSEKSNTVGFRLCIQNSHRLYIYFPLEKIVKILCNFGVGSGFGPQHWLMIALCCSYRSFILSYCFASALVLGPLWWSILVQAVLLLSSFHNGMVRIQLNSEPGIWVEPVNNILRVHQIFNG
jgi:hypothetical protein